MIARRRSSFSAPSASLPAFHFLLIAGAGGALFVGCSDDSSGSDTEVPPPAGGVGVGGAAGAAGSAGQAGASGASAGSAGAAGSAGQGGSAGQAGASGQAGAGGASGQAGLGGSSGQGGQGGSSGQGGQGGSSGQGGSAGQGGSSGQGGGAGGSGQAGSAGAAGQAGAAGASGQGGSAQSEPCLDASTYAGELELDPSLPFCVIRRHPTGQSGVASLTGAPSWGRHGGPLTTSQPKDLPEITRWAVPTDPTAAATGTAAMPAITGVDKKVFFGPAFDVPFESFTLVPYTGMGASAPGEVIALNGALDAVVSRAAVNGFFAGVGLTSGGVERLVYTGLSGFGAPADTNDSGFWSTDVCSGQLLPSGGCATSKKIASWGSASGPVVTDGAGTVFATLSTFGAAQEIRAFTAASLLGDAPVDGTKAVSDGDFTGSLAALPPSGGEAGWLFVQESDAMTFAAKPLFAVRYTAAGGSVTPQAPTGPLVTVKSLDTPAVFADDQGRLWLFASFGAGPTFYALRAK